MKTYPLKRLDGSLIAFEIDKRFTATIRSILQSIPGVADLTRPPGSDELLTFSLYGKPWVVHDPWGDSGCYWIGPNNTDNCVGVEIVHQAFVSYKPRLLRMFARIPLTKADVAWCGFAWIGIPISFGASVLLTALPIRSEGGLLVTVLAFIACGTWIVAKRQRPKHSWVVLLYPFSMFFILVLTADAVVLLFPYPDIPFR